jgi:tRNA dimethylallyltransferase
LVSIDSMAVYRGMDIGTEKPLRTGHTWHLVDIADPWEDFSVARFQAVAAGTLAGIHARGHTAVLVGGTGLYHRAVLDGLDLPGRFPAVAAELEVEAQQPGGLERLYGRLGELDPVAAGRMEAGNKRRIVRALEVTLGSGRRFSSFGPGLEDYGASRACLVGLALERAEVDRRLWERLQAELETGFVDEVRALMARPEGLSKTARQAIGYAELLGYLAGEMTLDEATAAILRRLKSFARRQESWFRRDPRITWLDADRPDLRAAVLDIWHGGMADAGARRET